MRNWILFFLLTVGGCSAAHEPTVWELPGDRSSNVALDDLIHEDPLVKTVPANQGDAIESGYLGDGHPLLANQSELLLTARWTALGTGRAANFGYFPLSFYQPFKNLKPVSDKRLYDVADLSAFLPAEVGDVGQVWAIDERAVTRMLRQFHPSGSVRLKAPGRRAGPNGAFAILRGKSPMFLDIVFRVHGEFRPAPDAYITPSHFDGRMVVNLQSKNVHFFQLAVPTDQLLNVTLTYLRDSEALIDLVTVEHLDLVGGSPYLDNLTFTDELAMADARRQLKGVFYKFMDIDWIDPAEAVAQARERKQPIMAVVLWGALDEQSC